MVITGAERNSGIGIKLYGSQYIRITGTGDATLGYGIEIHDTANAAVDTNQPGMDDTAGTEYVEFDHIYAHNVGAGFRMAKNNALLDTDIPWSGHQYYIHDNWIRTTTAEAMYIGSSDSHGIFPIYDVEVWNNRIEDAGYDGIQIRQAHSQVLVHDNYIQSTGGQPCKNGTLDNTAGFNIAKGTDTGDWYNNTVIGARTAFYIKDAANVRVFNNLIIDSGHSNSVLTSVECPANRTQTAPEGAAQIINSSGVEFMFNTVANPNILARYGISIDQSTGVIHDNILAGNFENFFLGTGITMTHNLTNSEMDYFKFVAPENNDYHLSELSPAIDAAGTSSFPWSDLDRWIRPQGNYSDVGAYEYHGPKVTSDRSR